jgi:TonB family protein
VHVESTGDLDKKKAPLSVRLRILLTSFLHARFYRSPLFQSAAINLVLFSAAAIMFWNSDLPRKQTYGSTFINITLDEPEPANTSSGPEDRAVPIDVPEAETAEENQPGEVESRPELFSTANDNKKEKTKQTAVQSTIRPAEREATGRPVPAGKTPVNFNPAVEKESSAESRELSPPTGTGSTAAKKKIKTKRTFAESEASGEAPVSLDLDTRGDIPLSDLIDTPAAITEQGELNYPEEFKNQEISTASTIDVYLNKDGDVVNLQIARSASDGRAFDEAAIRMILGSTFSPAYAGDLAVPCIVRMEVVFNTRVEGSEAP